MPIQKVARNSFGSAVLGFERLDCGFPQAVKRFDRVRITLDGVYHTHPVASQPEIPPLLHYAVWRDFTNDPVEGTITGVTEQRQVNTAWVFYLDRACWGRAVDVEFEFQDGALREDTLVRPPVEIDFEIIRER